MSKNYECETIRQWLNHMGAIAVLVLSCATAFADLPSPIAWWKMDAVSGGMVADASGNGRVLTIGADCFSSNLAYGVDREMPTLYYPGTTASTASFSCPALTSRTVSMWVCREAGDGPLSPSVNSAPYFLSYVSGMHLVGLRATASTPGLGEVSFRGGYAPKVYAGAPRCSWHHIAVVVSVSSKNGDGTYNGSITTYVNGAVYNEKLDCTFPASLSTAETGYIGNHSNGNRPLFGHVGETRIYDTALSAGQVREIFDEVGHCALLAHWDMEEIISDGSGGRHIAGTGGGPSLALGTAMSLANGIDGMALLFDPRDATSLANTYALSEPKIAACREVTVSMWLNVARDIKDTATLVPEGGTACNNIPMIWRDTGSSSRIMIDAEAGMDVNNTRLGVFFGGDGLCTNDFRQGYAEKGVWSHVALAGKIVKDADSHTGLRGFFDIYVNGEKVGETVTGTNLTAETIFSKGGIRIGCHTDNGGSNNIRVFKGMIDDFRIYYGMLGEAEVRAIYRGAAAVDAGEDFTVASSTATLRGEVASSARLPQRNGYAGDIAWEIVETPPGGEAASFESSSSPVTRVTLPVLGTYRFRLVSTAMSVSRSSEVSVTRVAAVSGNVAPTVSLSESAIVALNADNALCAAVADPDSGPGTLRTSWNKVSGPGGAWFSPANSNYTHVSFSAVGTYMLRCTAEDGQDSSSAEVSVTVEGDSASGFDVSSIANGLIAHYNFNGGSTNGIVEGAASLTIPSLYTEQHLTPALDGLGYRGDGFASFASLPATGFREAEGNNVRPTNQWLSVSLWMYHDADNPGANDCWNPSLISQRHAFDLMYYLQGDGGSHGFWLFQDSGGKKYDFTPAKDPANRWTHVYAAFDRFCVSGSSDKSELWIDGVKQTPSVNAYGNARCYSTSITIGGCDAKTGTYDHPDGYWTNSVGTRLSRTFPGIIDEVRAYNRKLSADEIRFLATHPVVDENLAPDVDDCIVSSSSVSAKTEAVDMEVPVFDDGIPNGSTLSYSWHVLSGKPSYVAFSSPNACNTSVTFAKGGAYVLQLAASDGERTAYSTPVTVNAMGPGFVVTFR